MTVCADVEALIPMQTPFCQFCPGGQCSFPPSSSHSFGPFPPTMFLLFLPQLYSHFVKQIPTNSAWTSSSLLYSHSSLSLSLLFQILIPANQTKPFRTLLHTCTLQSYFQTKPITQNSPVPWIWEEVQIKTLWPSQTRPIWTNPNQTRPIRTKLNQTFYNSPAPCFWQPISPAPLHLAANALRVKRLPVCSNHLQKQDILVISWKCSRIASWQLNQSYQPIWHRTNILPPKE